MRPDCRGIVIIPRDMRAVARALWRGRVLSAGADAVAGYLREAGAFRCCRPLIRSQAGWLLAAWWRWAGAFSSVRSPSGAAVLRPGATGAVGRVLPRLGLCRLSGAVAGGVPRWV